MCKKIYSVVGKPTGGGGVSGSEVQRQAGQRLLQRKIFLGVGNAGERVRVFEEQAVGARALAVQENVGAQPVDFGVAQRDDARVGAVVRRDGADPAGERVERDEQAAQRAFLAGGPGIRAYRGNSRASCASQASMRVSVSIAWWCWSSARPRNSSRSTAREAVNS